MRDIDDQVRPFGAWDIGADERDATTAVKLSAFSARPFSGAVRVEWETASELENLGFHVYRGLSGSGPWTRLNGSLISGLGSSAVGRSYSWLDSGLTNGVRYFYRLEDVDTRSKVTSHGPVSAVPDAALADPTQGQRDETGAGREDDKGGDKKTAKDACPAWVVSAYGQTAPSGAAAPLRCSRHGKPESVGARGAVAELARRGARAAHGRLLRRARGGRQRAPVRARLRHARRPGRAGAAAAARARGRRRRAQGRAAVRPRRATSSPTAA